MEDKTIPKNRGRKPKGGKIVKNEKNNKTMIFQIYTKYNLHIFNIMMWRIINIYI